MFCNIEANDMVSVIEFLDTQFDHFNRLISQSYLVFGPKSPNSARVR